MPKLANSLGIFYGINRRKWVNKMSDLSYLHIVRVCCIAESFQTHANIT